MARFFLLVVGLLITTVTYPQTTGWKIVPGKITTPWAERVNPQAVLPEYPRPQMVRIQWLNLNGLWSYALTAKGAAAPASYEGHILVPFPLESALSGVGKTAGNEKQIWYRRTVIIPRDMRAGKILLHFGAVDWECEVFINGKSAGTHQGGYDPFYFDITGLVTGSGAQEIAVRVWDPTNDGPQPRGKQVNKPESIWYTPVSGIWQTVWLEAVPPTYIAKVKNTPDIDKAILHTHVTTEGLKPGDIVRASAWTAGAKVAEATGTAQGVSLKIPDPKLWSPANPFLYDLRISIIRKGKVIDEVGSYFGMRKISLEKDANGIMRIALNNEFLFQYGPLDQGWWPDGLYTGPSDDALRFDVVKTKEMGFNMIRKHVKVEPARWYYHCDREGMLVWQDMPSGDMGNRWESRPGIIGIATSRERTPQSEAIFRKEWKAIIDNTWNFPSIVVWVPFNEAWGQFKTEEIVEWTTKYDSSRLVNAASGGNFVAAGHMIDLHNYPSPAMPDPQIWGKERAVVLGEFGGLALPLEGHTWQEKDNWGYQKFSSREDLSKRYNELISALTKLVPQGLSAAVYTQTTDVEIEVNGLMTYDRREIKIPAGELKSVHEPLYKAYSGK